MKSAYELAMERLGKNEPAAKPLSAEQKARLAEIDTLHRSKWAEREIFLKEKLEDALSKGDADAVEQIRLQITREKARLEEDREDEKERVRSARA